MKTKIRIAVFTGTRAEYGLLKNLIKLLSTSPQYELTLIVSGTHLSNLHGYTLDEIIEDGLSDYEKVCLSLDSAYGGKMDYLAGEAMIGIGDVLRKNDCQFLVVLGDRYEAFAAAASAHLVGAEIIHLHGGESTLGAVDDRLRHAITQLSTWHFTAAEEYQRRVMTMVDEPDNVFNVGPMVIDSLMSISPIGRSEFEIETGYSFGLQNLLVTYHPETVLKNKGVDGFIHLLRAITEIKCNVLFTYPNADEGGDTILKLLKDYVHTNSNRCMAIPSLGQTMYLRALMLFEAIAGNSSSGIIEGPLVGAPVLNIGRRQHGRIRYGNVTDVNADYESILEGLKTVFEKGSDEAWPRAIKTKRMSPSAAIISTLSEVIYQ